MLGNLHRLKKEVLISLFLVFTIYGISQEPDLKKTISVNYDDIPLEKVLQDITAKSGIKFSYSANTIDIGKKIHISSQNNTVESILEEVFKQANVEYEIVGMYLVLKKLTPTEETPQPPRIKYYTISGYISDSSDNEVLIGAAIYHKETGRGVLSNNYGFFSLTLPEGTYNIEASYLGYKVIGKTLNLNKNVTWKVQLTPSPSMVEEVIISSYNEEERIFSSLAAQSNIKATEVKQRSAAMGETDMLKSLDNLPGISFHNEGSSYFYVRGGNRDQNLIILDEATIYNPSHLFGLFTPIIPDAVKNTEIYKADFPAQYGGRLSSVIDIRTRDGNMQRLSGSASIGLVSTRYRLEGPFKKNASSFFLSYRRSHFGMLFKSALPAIQDFYFNDFTSKLNFKLGDKDRLFITFYTGKDIFLIEENEMIHGLEWGNSMITLRWNHVYGNKLFSNVTFYTSNYDYFLHTDYENKINWNSHIANTNLKTEFTYFYNPKNKARFGINLGAYEFNPGNYNLPGLPDDLRVSKMNSGEIALYLGNEQEIDDWLRFHYGARVTYWANYGEAFVVQYDEYNNPEKTLVYNKGEKYYGIQTNEPRFSFSFKTGPYSSIKTSYNHTIQHINLINNSISPFNSLEVWLPSGPNIKPQHADIFNLGYLKTWPKYFIDISADMFLKKMTNQIGYRYHAQMQLNPYLEGELKQGDGRAYGFEFLLKKSMGKLSGHLGYAYTRSYLKIEGLNEGRKYPSHQDRPVDFSLLLDYQAKPRWLLNLNILYTSGMRISTPTGFYYYRGEQVPIYTEQNNDKLPDYKRVDIGTTIHLNKLYKPTSHTLNISLYNFFSYQNYAFLNFNKIINSEGEYVVHADLLNPPEQLVTYRYIYAMVPSITYTLSF